MLKILLLSLALIIVGCANQKTYNKKDYYIYKNIPVKDDSTVTYKKGVALKCPNCGETIPLIGRESGEINKYECSCGVAIRRSCTCASTQIVVEYPENIQPK